MSVQYLYIYHGVSNGFCRYKYLALLTTTNLSVVIDDSNSQAPKRYS